MAFRKAFSRFWWQDPLTGEENVTFEKEQVRRAGWHESSFEVQEDPAEFYATTGNHNDWDAERMQEGNVRL